jgi:carbamoyltransferase
MLTECHNGKIDVLHRTFLPDSLGHFYTAMCQFIGFHEFGEEYKVMGLAPYGSNEYGSEIEKIIKFCPHNLYRLNKEYVRITKDSVDLTRSGNIKVGKLYTDRLIELLGQPRNPGALIEQRHMDIAKSTQIAFENIVLSIFEQWYDPSRHNGIVMAGGCALNGVTNAKILREFDISNYYWQCASSDDGLALGAAASVASDSGVPLAKIQMPTPFLGPRYSENHVKNAVGRSQHQSTYYHSIDELITKVAQHLTEGDVVGFFHGRAEWGPRALGNRSILADPKFSSMKETLNRKIKKRESFRPFAPSILEEDVPNVFEQAAIKSPYMMHVSKIRERYRTTYPSVTHVDGTGRLQTVSRDNNERFYLLLKEIKKINGIGILLNTSFNENEPIVTTPEQALACFDRTEIDVLVLENFILRK